MKNFLSLTLGFSIALAVAGNAFAEGKPTSVTGTLEDSYCYGTMGAKGSGHKACAIKCAQKGIPVSLVEQGTDKIYVLLPAKNDTSMPEEVTNRMEDNVTVTGKSYKKGGVNFLVLESVK
jgi:hypothetical protein